MTQERISIQDDQPKRLAKLKKLSASVLASASALTFGVISLEAPAKGAEPSVTATTSNDGSNIPLDYVWKDGDVWAENGAVNNGYSQNNGTTVDIAYVPTPGETENYDTVSSSGAVAVFGAGNTFKGDPSGLNLNKPVVGMAVTPDGGGYWEVASDGGIFAYGDAEFYGGMGGTAINQPIVGIASTPDGKGYWEVASDGGIFSFGDADFYGSMGGTAINQPIVGMAPTIDGGGYWEAGKDGGVFSFGDASYNGSLPAEGQQDDIIGIQAAYTGYVMLNTLGKGYMFASGSENVIIQTGTRPDVPVVGFTTFTKS